MVGSVIKKQRILDTLKPSALKYHRGALKDPARAGIGEE